MSYAIPGNEVSLTDRKNFVNSAIDAGIARALALGIARTKEELVWREAHPGTDFTDPAGSGWTNEYYITPGAAGALAWALAPDTGNPPQLGRTKVAVFYKIFDTAEDPVVTAVRFRVGVTGATTKASFFIQLPLDVKLEPEMWLSQPVVYDPEDWLYIEFYGRVATAAGGEELGFGCYIVERVGGTIS